MKKIVVIGPESTGKSTLCEQLAAHYNTLWVPEYAREHLLREGNRYTYDDLLVIAQRQVALENEYMSRSTSDILFIDTDMYVMKVWCEFVFGKCHQWILSTIAERNYDMYFLCGTGLPWVKDELREYPDLASRLKLFHIYKDIMVNQHVPWKEIHGSYEQRFGAAVSTVDGLLK